MAYTYSISQRKNADKVYTQEELYLEYYKPILKMLISRNRDVMDSEDICHDAFVKLFTVWDSIEWNRLEQLMSRVVYNSVVDYYKKNGMIDNQTSGSKTLELIDEGLISDPMKDIGNREFREVFQKAFATLSKSEKPIFYSFYLEDKTVEELRNGRTVGTVLKLLSRARDKMSYFFEKNYIKD